MADDHLKTFMANVQARMVALDLSQRELSARAGLSQKTVNNLFNGRHAPQLIILTKIAAAVDVELWQLFVPQTSADQAVAS